MSENIITMTPKDEFRESMQSMAPERHAAMGWAHGEYKDGYCHALMASASPDEVSAFKADAVSRGAVYVDLRNLKMKSK